MLSYLVETQLFINSVFKCVGVSYASGRCIEGIPVTCGPVRDEVASATDTEEKSLIMQGVSSFCLGLSMLYNSEQIEAFSIEKLKDIVKKRIGIEQFEQKLEYISQHEAYTKTLKQPKFAFISVKPNDLLFDYEFTRLYKSNETLIINLLKNKKHEERRDSNASSDSRVSSDHQNALILNQYKQLIREQDTKLKEQQQLNQTLTKTCSQLQLSIQELMAKSGSNSPSEKLQYETRINQLEVKCNLLEEKCTEQEDDLCKLQREKGVLEETINNLKTMDKNTEVFELRSQNSELRRELAQINQDQENLLTLLQEMEVKLNNYKRLLKEHGEKVSEDEEEAESKNNESSESSEKDEALPNNIHLVIDSKNTSSSDSHLVLNNNFMNGSHDNSASSSDQVKGESELLTVPTGENVDLVTLDSKPFNFLQYFNNPVQSDQFVSNQKQPGNELDLM
ncbi:General vesicular transport factor p115-like protein [Brachionus plicatilis]|uniref:General vesicular transport factor p115-like protein n=1 Tax=Brachionus plicatilis TaxID=10195 RepID=A0A3M7SDX2_BRAPC|nr:General vesicular transport factor p115-like protein [Brachionus plicatilis]